MTVRIFGVACALVGMLGVGARGAVQITHSIAELSMTAAASSFVFPCSHQVHVETFGNTELNCVSEASTGRAESIISLSMSSNSDNTGISLRLRTDSQVSGGDGIPTHTLFAGGVGWVNLGIAVTDEPMQATVTIVDIGTDDAGPSNFKQRMTASWSFGSAGGEVNSHAGRTTQTGVLTGTIQPGQSGLVFLEFEDVFADHTNPNTFAHVELNLQFQPAICSAPNSASAAAPETIHWKNPSGGSYSVASNWNPEHVPEGGCGDGDTAIFDVNTGSTIAIEAADATAGRWRFLNGAYEVSGPAELFSSSPADPSLEITGGTLTLEGSDPLSVDLVSVNAAIGQGPSPSFMEVTTSGAVWENAGLIKVGNGTLTADPGVEIYTDEFLIGSVNGAEGKVVLVDEFGGDGTFVKVAGILTVGGSGSGLLEVREGAVMQADEIGIGEVGEGSVLIKGTSNNGDPLNTDDFASLLADTILSVGGAGGGTLTIEDGGGAQAKYFYINRSGGQAGRVIVDGQGGFAILNVLDTLAIGADAQVEVEARNGGLIQVQEAIIGFGSGQIHPGAADLTIRGSATQPDPARQSKLRVFDQPHTLGPAKITYVGSGVTGQLNILEGGQASLDGGLVIGENVRGIVVVSAPALPLGTLRSNLSVTGETLVGGNAPGILSIGPRSDLVTTGDVRIGLGGGNPNGSLNVTDACNVTVNGTLAVGFTGAGLLAANLGVGGLGNSIVRCDTLLVGGNTAQGTGRVDADVITQLEVSGNAQVGVGAGLGEVFLDEASLLIGGTLTIGNPAGGPGGGLVVLMDADMGADIGGTGSIVVNPNGSLIGTGRITVPQVNAGGQIAVQNRPLIPLPRAGANVIGSERISSLFTAGTLTIDGDYELLPTGAQIIEYAGLNPGEFDRLIVTGTATLGGRLEVHFRNGFSPPDPNAFIHSQDFIEPDQGIVGDYTQRIYAFPDLFADFDSDGDKDLKDVRAFQNCFGLSGNGLQPACDRADWEDNGVINEVEVKELSSRLTGPG